MKRHTPKRAQAQRRMRKRKNEHAYLFTVEGHLLAEVERDTWEFAIAVASGDVARAAEACGLGAIPKGAKALWGRSAVERHGASTVKAAGAEHELVLAGNNTVLSHRAPPSGRNHHT